MNDELRALSDKAHARLEVLEELYVRSLKEGNNGMAAVIQGERAAAVAYAQGVEDCRGLIK